jgi:hypothetical protein
MNIQLHIRIPFALHCDWERQEFADDIIRGILVAGDKSPKYDSGMPFVIEWICRKFTQSYCLPTAVANFDDTVELIVCGTAVQQYKMLSMFIVYWVATHRSEFENSVPADDIWNQVSQILSENVDSFSVYTKLEEKVAWANEIAARTLFSC